jgi:hypothetical protein
MICQKCGKENTDDSKHCKECGTALYPSVELAHFSPEPVGIFLGIILIAGLYLLPVIPLTSLDSSASVVTSGWIPLAHYLSLHDSPPYFYGISLGRWTFYLLWLAGLSMVLISLCRRVKE